MPPPTRSSAGRHDAVRLGTHRLGSPSRWIGRPARPTDEETTRLTRSSRLRSHRHARIGTLATARSHARVCIGASGPPLCRCTAPSTRNTEAPSPDGAAAGVGQQQASATAQIWSKDHCVNTREGGNHGRAVLLCTHARSYSKLAAKHAGQATLPLRQRSPPAGRARGVCPPPAPRRVARATPVGQCGRPGSQWRRTARPCPLHDSIRRRDSRLWAS